MFPVFYQQSRTLFHDLASSPAVKYFLDPLEQHHADSRLHCLRTGLLAIDIGYSLGLPERLVYELGLAGMLHDVGKRGVAYCLLDKDGKPTDEEWRAIKAHVRLGFVTLRESAAREDAQIRLSESISRIVVGHHEYQGTRSYPRSGKDRRTIPRSSVPERRQRDLVIEGLSQALAVADVYDALSSPRAYKPGFPVERVAEILHQDFTGSKHYVHEVLRRGIPNVPAGLVSMEEIVGLN